MRKDSKFKEIEVRQSVGASGVNIRLNLLQCYRLTHGLKTLQHADKIDVQLLHSTGVIALLDMIQQTLEFEEGGDMFSIESMPQPPHP